MPGLYRIDERPLDLQDAIRAVAGPDRGAIATFVGTTRNHHDGRSVRFRMLGLLDARILNPRLPEKRVQQIRRERDELERIYEATWLELENAIGSQAAEAIRKSVEETTEAGAVQLDLPLEKKRNFDLEREARCNQ